MHFSYGLLTARLFALVTFALLRSALAEEPNPNAAFHAAKMVNTANCGCDQRADRWIQALKAAGYNPVQVTTFSVSPRAAVVSGGDPWNFHTAPAIRTACGTMIIDPEWFPAGPVPLNDWAKRVGGAPVIHSPSGPYAAVNKRKHDSLIKYRNWDFPETPTTTVACSSRGCRPTQVGRAVEASRSNLRLSTGGEGRGTSCGGLTSSVAPCVSPGGSFALRVAANAGFSLPGSVEEACQYVSSVQSRADDIFYDNFGFNNPASVVQAYCTGLGKCLADIACPPPHTGGIDCSCLDCRGKSRVY